jgi:hypothetical protein
VVNRTISDDDVGHEQLLEHIGANVSSLQERLGSGALDVHTSQCRRDEVLLYIIKVDAALRAERTEKKLSSRATFSDKLNERAKMRWLYTLASCPSDFKQRFNVLDGIHLLNGWRIYICKTQPL